MAGELVSVIVPTFNRAYCLPRTLDSALRQTYANLEILVVDDGSQDETAEMIARDYGDEPRVKYLHQENGGVSSARNLGIKHARGEYVAFLDSDDIWEPWKLELQVSAMDLAPAIGMVWTDMAAVAPDGKVVSNAYLKTMYRAYRFFRQKELFPSSYPLEKVAPHLTKAVAGTASLHVGEIFSKMIMGNMVHTSTVLVRRKIIDAIKGFNEELKISGEDYDFHLRTCREGPVGFIDVSSIRYQIGLTDQLTHSSCSIHIAHNFLRTIEPFIREERDRIDLPEDMITSVLAHANEWIGWELFLNGECKAAEAYYLKSLSFRPFSPKTLALLVLAAMPRLTAEALLKHYRKFRSSIGRP